MPGALRRGRHSRPSPQPQTRFPPGFPSPYRYRDAIPWPLTRLKRHRLTHMQHTKPKKKNSPTLQALNFLLDHHPSKMLQKGECMVETSHTYLTAQEQRRRNVENEATDAHKRARVFSHSGFLHQASAVAEAPAQALGTPSDSQAVVPVRRDPHRHWRARGEREAKSLGACSGTGRVQLVSGTALHDSAPPSISRDSRAMWMLLSGRAPCFTFAECTACELHRMREPSILARVEQRG